jgi:hypothetical protein
MAQKVAVSPAVSRELKFIADNVDEADDIYQGRIKVEPSLKRLSDKVYERADADVSELLNELKEELSCAVKGVLRINDWRTYRRWSWGIWSPIYMARGRKKKIGSAGLTVDYGQEGLRAIGWVDPRGGLHGRTEFTRSCQKKFPKVHLVSENAKRYPNWNDVVVWFDEKLTLKTSRKDIRDEVATQAKQFFRFAKSLLNQ